MPAACARLDNPGPQKPRFVPLWPHAADNSQKSRPDGAKTQSRCCIQQEKVDIIVIDEFVNRSHSG